MIFSCLLINVNFVIMLTTNTLYAAYHKGGEIVLQCLERDFSKMSEWFKQNSMILNPKKCHFMMIGDSTEGPDFNFEGTTIKYCTKAKIIHT